MRPVDQLLGHDMGDIVGRLHAPSHMQDAGAHHDRAEAFEHARPDDQVGDARLVFHGHETHPAGRARPLADKDEAGDDIDALIGASRFMDEEDAEVLSLTELESLGDDALERIRTGKLPRITR